MIAELPLRPPHEHITSTIGAVIKRQSVVI
jgi:hypothetical protein